MGDHIVLSAAAATAKSLDLFQGAMIIFPSPDAVKREVGEGVREDAGG